MGLRLMALTFSQLKPDSSRNQRRNTAAATAQNGRSIQASCSLLWAANNANRIQRNQRIGIASTGDATRRLM